MCLALLFLWLFDSAVFKMQPGFCFHFMRKSLPLPDCKAPRAWGREAPPAQPLAGLHRGAAPAGGGFGEYHYKTGIFRLPL